MFDVSNDAQATRAEDDENQGMACKSGTPFATVSGSKHTDFNQVIRGKEKRYSHASDGNQHAVQECDQRIDCRLIHASRRSSCSMERTLTTRLTECLQKLFHTRVKVASKGSDLTPVSYGR
jgi:hypothetical protein